MALLPPPPGKFKGLLAACAVGLALFALNAVYGDHGLVHLLSLQAAQQELEHRAFELQQHNEHLRQQAQRLQSDDRYIEKQARERLGLVKKGELVYRVSPPAVASIAR